MAISKKNQFIIDELQKLYPNTASFLHFRKDYELLFATILSAQATDKSVNEATEKLFVRCPTLADYNEANREMIMDSIKKVGLGKSKCEYLIKTAKILLSDFDGRVPKDRKALMTLPGVGFKTSGVVLGELYDYPYIPVDTHVYRVTHRIGIANDSLDPSGTELVLEKAFKGCHCIHLHRQFILLGRNICSAQNPKCDVCPFVSICRSYKRKKRVQT